LEAAADDVQDDVCIPVTRLVCWCRWNLYVRRQNFLT